MFAGRELKPNDFDVLYLLYEHSAVLVSTLTRARNLSPDTSNSFHALIDPLFLAAKKTLNDLGGENTISNYERISIAVLNNHKIFFYLNAFAVGISVGMDDAAYSAHIPVYEQMQNILAPILTDPDSLKNRMEKILGKLRSYNNTSNMHYFFGVHTDCLTNTYKEKHLDVLLEKMIAEFSYAISRIAELNVSINVSDILNGLYAGQSGSLLEIMHVAAGIRDANAKHKFLEVSLQPHISEIEARLKEQKSSPLLLPRIVWEGKDESSGSIVVQNEQVPRERESNAGVNSGSQVAIVEDGGEESLPANLDFAYSARLIATLEQKIKKLNQAIVRISYESSQANQLVDNTENPRIFSIAKSNEDANRKSESAIHEICKQQKTKLDSLVDTIELYQHHMRCCKRFLKDLENCGDLFSKIEKKIRESFGNFLLMHASTTHIFINYFLQDNIQKIKSAMPVPATGDASLIERKRYAALCFLLSNVKRILDEDANTAENLAGFLDEVIVSTHVDINKDFPDQFALNQSLREIYYAIPGIKDTIPKSLVKSWYRARYDEIENEILVFMIGYKTANLPAVFLLLQTLRDNLNHTDEIYVLDRNNQFFAMNYYAVGGEILSSVMKGFAAETGNKCIEFSGRLAIWSHAINQYGIFNSKKIAVRIAAVADIFSETKEEYSRVKMI
jgi:hypothetical protein